MINLWKERIKVCKFSFEQEEQVARVHGVLWAKSCMRMAIVRMLRIQIMTLKARYISQNGRHSVASFILRKSDII